MLTQLSLFLRKNKRLISHIFIIALFSLVPVIWLRDNYVILGHDAGFPLSPWSHFLDRLFMWTRRFGLGSDQTMEVGGFFIHGYEGILDLLGLSLNQIQILVFSTYFVFFGLSMYALAKEVFPSRNSNIPILASIFYMFNHFILQAWFIVERTKFTLYIALPLLILLLFRIVHKKTHPVKAGLIASIIIFVLNGGGFFPLYGAIAIAMPLIGVILVLTSNEKAKTFKRLAIFSFVWFVGTLLVSAFWLLPYIRFVSTSYSQELNTAGGIDGVIAWVQSISLHSSIHNILRLQGIPEWYANPLHPYASIFMNNVYLRITSYLIPICAFGGFIFAKEKNRDRLLVFIGLALFSIIFIAGSHPPFGFFYMWLIKNVPGFVIFRTPFYKFAPALWLSYALLVSFTFDRLIRKFSPSNMIRHIATIAVIAGVVLYSFPFFTGSFFDYERNVKSTRVQVPQYVHDYADWANSDEFPYKRILLLPGQNANTRFEAYTWGYWSLAQLHGLISNQSYISNSSYKAVTEEAFIKNLYSLIEVGDPSWVDQAQLLFIDAVLLRKDFDYTLENSRTTDPLLIEAFLNNDPRFEKTHEFGKWVLYQLNEKSPALMLKNAFYEVHAQSNENFFEATTIPGVIIGPETVLVEKSIPELSSRRLGMIYIPTCIRCALDSRKIYPVSRDQIVTAGSIFYKSQVTNNRDKIEKADSISEKAKLSVVFSQTLLYKIQSQFLRNAPEEERIAGWQDLVDALDIQDKYIKEYISQKEISEKENQFMTELYENILHIRDEFENVINDINREEEAVLFQSAIENINNQIEYIEKIVWYTKDNTSKRYYFEASEQGTYQVFVRKNTSNAFSGNYQQDEIISMSNNGIDYPILRDVHKQSESWQQLGSIDVQSGVNRFSLEEPTVITNIVDSPFEFQLSAAGECHMITLPTLSKDLYKLHVSVSGQENITDLFVFLDTEKADRPLLPYWGRKLLIDSGKSTKLDFIETINEPGVYTLRFCRLSAEDKRSQQISIEDIELEKISIPLVAFVKLEDAMIHDRDTISIASNRENNTKYSLLINGEGSAILMFDQRFDKDWTVDPQVFISNHVRLHGYANGWIINKDVPGDITYSLTYQGQKTYIIGWIVSLISVIVFLIGIAYFEVKKKDLW